MAFKFVCAETGAKCPFEVVATTKEEVMKHVMIHAKMSHPEMAATPRPSEMLAQLIHLA